MSIVRLYSFYECQVYQIKLFQWSYLHHLDDLNYYSHLSYIHNVLSAVSSSLFKKGMNFLVEGSDKALKNGIRIVSPDNR